MNTLILCLMRGVPILLHSIAFTMLYRTKYTNKFKQVQRFYLLNLSFVEISLCILSIITIISRGHPVNFYFLWLRLFTFNTMFFVLYIMLTLDRFLIAFLNLRYYSIVTLAKVGSIIGCLYGLVFFISIIIYIVYPRNGDFPHHLTNYFWPIGDVVYIVIAIVTYIYIFTSSRKMKPHRGIGMGHHSRRSRIPSSTVLIVSYLMTFSIPDFIWAGFDLSDKNLSTTLQTVAHGWYSFGFCVDAIIYIFSLKSITCHWPYVRRFKRSVIHKFSQDTIEVASRLK